MTGADRQNNNRPNSTPGAAGSAPSRPEWMARAKPLLLRFFPRPKRSVPAGSTRPMEARKPIRIPVLRLLSSGSSGGSSGRNGAHSKKKGLRSHFWKVPYFFEHMALAERTWGWLRLGGALVAVAVFVFISWRFAGSSYDLLSLRGLRHMIFPLAALLGAFLVAGHYLQDIYELPSTRLGLRYLFSTAFGFLYPRLRIENGARQIKPGDINLVDTIGGPGILIVQPGNAVICERLTEPATVFGGGFHFLTRYETVKEIVSLQDQHGSIEQTSATTKDGIEVIVRDIHYRYRVRNGRRYGDYNRRTPDEPYPFSIQALRNLTYNRTVSSNGISSWHHMVRLAVDSVITDYVQSVNFDNLTSPRYGDEDPRAGINARLEKKELRDRLKRTGAELLWCDIGRFDMPEKVDDTHVDFWAVPWAGDAMLQRVQGEARHLALQELGRAEAQADLLKSIHLSMAGLDLSDKHNENMRKLILIRTAQILEALAQSNPKTGADSFPQLVPPESS